MRAHPPVLAGLLAGLLAALLAGCGDPAPPPLYPLTGTVTRGGTAVPAGGLIFVPESGDWGGAVVNASVRPDGTFAAETSRTAGEATTVRPGAPAGRYHAVYHPPGDGQKVGSEYQFPDPVTVGAKDNAVTLVLPDGPPGDKASKPADDPKGGGARGGG